MQSEFDNDVGRVRVFPAASFVIFYRLTAAVVVVIITYDPQGTDVKDR
jgi:hypothetical protein